MLPTTTDVLIVGAGPTGLALAIALQQAGVSHVLIDKLLAGQNTTRAAVIHAQTLDALEPLGVTQSLIAGGLTLKQFSLYDRDHALLRLRFDKLPTAHPYLLMVSQEETERVLGDRLVELGGQIHRGVVATAISQDQTGATATVVCDGEERTIAARYIVGADGMRSLTREAAGIEFDGGTYAESCLLADVRLTWPLGPDEVRLFVSPAGMAVVAPLPGGLYRIVASHDNPPHDVTITDVQQLMDQRGPLHGQVRVDEVVWGSRFRLHHRLAQAYRRNRLLLMGDAAHVHSPVGGQGMNTGLIDACVLGRLLAEVVQGQRPDSALDTYEQLRRPAAAKVLALAGRLTELATARGAPKQAARNLLMSVVNRIPAAKRRLAMNLSGLSRRQFAELPA